MTALRREWIWQSEDWPNLRYDFAPVMREAMAALRPIHELNGVTRFFDVGTAMTLASENLEETAITTSRIEGEVLARDSVRSSVAKRLGLSTAGLPEPESKVRGVVSMLHDATANHDAPLTKTRLCDWQKGLFTEGEDLGDWRKSGDMRVVSGAKFGEETVHFQAPPCEAVPAEMKSFLKWVNEVPEEGHLLRAGLAHLRFVTIHPFQDGNGRVARAITDMLLAKHDGSRHRFFSLTADILKNKKSYYDILEQTQRGDGDVTAWMVWFLTRVRCAGEDALAQVESVRWRARFWMQHAETDLSTAQRKVLNRLMDKGFIGGINSGKYASIAGVSKSTAMRDLSDLVEKGCLIQTIKSGRNAAFELIRSR
jgi:Fic family protein